MFDSWSKERLTEALQMSQERVANLNAVNFELRTKLNNAESRLNACEAKASHFDVLIKAVDENVLVKSAWEKFMLTLRMSGYDKSTGS